MEAQTFTPWIPEPLFRGRVTLASLRDENGGLVIDLSSQNRAIRLRLKFSQVVAYRCIDESYRHRTWRSTTGQKLPSLLSVDRSRWIAWLRVESDGILDDVELYHFAILTDDDCIDVVAKTIPETELVPI